MNDVDRVYSEVKKDSKKRIDVCDGKDGEVYIDVTSNIDGISQGIHFKMDKSEFSAFLSALQEHKK